MRFWSWWLKQTIVSYANTERQHDKCLTYHFRAWFVAFAGTIGALLLGLFLSSPSHYFKYRWQVIYHAEESPPVREKQTTCFQTSIAADNFLFKLIVIWMLRTEGTQIAVLESITRICIMFTEEPFTWPHPAKPPVSKNLRDSFSYQLVIFTPWSLRISTSMYFPTITCSATHIPL